MGCEGRPGPQAAIAVFEEATGVRLTGPDWHYLKAAVAAQWGRPISRKRADSVAAAEAAVELVRSLQIDGPEAERFIETFYKAVNTQSTVDTVSYLAAAGAPDEVLERKRRGDGKSKGDPNRCEYCGEYADESHACAPKKTPEEKKDEAEEKLLAAVDSITNGEEFKKALDFASNVYNYSFGNSLMLMFDHAARHAADPENVPADPGYFQSFVNWKKGERYVTSGPGSGYPILIPNMRTARYYLDDNGQRVILKPKEKAPKGKDVKSYKYLDQKRRFLVGHVFAEYQTDGKPVPRPPKPQLLKGESVPELKEKVEGLLADAGYTVEYVDPDDKRLHGANGITYPESKEILVRNDVDDFQRDKTLVHEYAHATLHTGEGEYHHRGLGEVQAEAAAYLTFKTLADFDTDDYSMPYIAGWSTSLSSDPEERSKKTRAALNDVTKVTSAITKAFESDED